MSWSPCGIGPACWKSTVPSISSHAHSNPASDWSKMVSPADARRMKNPFPWELGYPKSCIRHYGPVRIPGKPVKPGVTITCLQLRRFPHGIRIMKSRTTARSSWYDTRNARSVLPSRHRYRIRAPPFRPADKPARNPGICRPGNPERPDRPGSKRSFTGMFDALNLPPTVRDRQDDVAADQFRPVAVVPVRGGQQARFESAGPVLDSGVLDRGDSGPVMSFPAPLCRPWRQPPSSSRQAAPPMIVHTGADRIGHAPVGRPARKTRSTAWPTAIACGTA